MQCLEAFLDAQRTPIASLFASRLTVCARFSQTVLDQPVTHAPRCGQSPAEAREHPFHPRRGAVQKDTIQNRCPLQRARVAAHGSDHKTGLLFLPPHAVLRILRGPKRHIFRDSNTCSQHVFSDTSFGFTNTRRPPRDIISIHAPAEASASRATVE